jgi:DNA end-binding protein Ku
VLYFADDLVPPKGLALPRANTTLDDEEITMAERLIDSLTDHFTPEKYTATYREGLQTLIKRKHDGLTSKTKPQRQRVATEEADLLAALKASIQRAEGKRKRALAA